MRETCVSKLLLLSLHGKFTYKPETWTRSGFFLIIHVIYLVQLGWFDESIYNLDLINFAFFFFVQNKMISSFLYFFL